MKTDAEREKYRTHLIHAISAVSIGVISILDGLIFDMTGKLVGFNPPWYVGVAVGIFLWIIAIPFGIKSHTALFGEDGTAPDHLVTSGVFVQVRNPMYFSILMFYLGIVAFSMSLFTLIAWIAIVFVYNWMVNHEEKILAEMFPKEYEQYKRRTHKWIPH